MRNFIGFSALILICSVSTAFASVSRDAWLKDLRLDMSQVSCNASSYFRKCFSETTDECVSTAEKAFDGCSARYNKQIPKFLEEKEFRDWRTKIKFCIGALMSITLEDAKKATADLMACGPKSDANATGQKISVDQYLEQMAISLPQDLCFEGMPHRTCYLVTEPNCRMGITRAVDQCRPTLKRELPSKLSISENRDWDMTVLECLAPIFDKEFAAKRSSKEAYCKTAISSLREKKQRRRLR